MDLTREQFIQRLTQAGWKQEEAEAEYERQMGEDGDIDGDLESWWQERGAR